MLGGLSKIQTEKRIKKLKEVISHHRYLYHVLDEEEISSDALDSLKHELYKLEQKYPEFITSDSPTQRIGGKPLSKFEKVAHKERMLSMEDIFSEDELNSWYDYLKRLAPSEKIDFYCEAKIDGFAVTLIYKKGILITGATRGNGKIGENVTQNLKTINSIPLKLRFLNEKENSKLNKIIKEEFEVRGEVYIEKKEFDEFNEKRKEARQDLYSNPRNLAAGSIRQLNSKFVANRPLKFLAYDIVTNFGQEYHSQEHEVLPGLGFKVNPGKKCKNLKEILDYRKEIAEKRKKLPFQIDGIVINVNNNSLCEKLGRVGKSLRGTRAFKFSPKQAVTIIEDIKIQIGRTGALTPVAVLKPVKIEGVTISRATLHNQDEIKKLGVKIGDTVIIERAGDVIPAVVKVLSDLRTGKEKSFRMPKKCPFCSSNLIKPKGEIIYRCLNKKCQAKNRKILSHFISKKGFDIKGMGPRVIDQLIDKKLVSVISDIFELKEGDLIPLEMFAEKSSKNIIKAIQESKHISLSPFLYSLGIRHVGEETANVLANYFVSIEKFKNIKLDELILLNDIGDVVAESIYQWFQNKKNIELIDNLLKAGIKISSPVLIEDKLKGKSFVFTGSLDSMSREEAKKRIRSLGGVSHSSISENTDYLVLGESSGLKHDKAKKLGVSILFEKEFLEMLKS